MERTGVSKALMQQKITRELGEHFNSGTTWLLMAYGTAMIEAGGLFSNQTFRLPLPTTTELSSGTKQVVARKLSKCRPNAEN